MPDETRVTGATQSQTALSERIRPNSEAAPWVIDEVKRLEAEAARLREAIDTFRGEVTAHASRNCCHELTLSRALATLDDALTRGEEMGR